MWSKVKQFLLGVERVSRERFYGDARVEKVEWWYSWAHEYPNLYFARLRTFSNGKADVLFQDEQKTYGFDNDEYAGNFISADEFSRLEHLDEDDRTFIGIPRDLIVEPPRWSAVEVPDFEYIGEY